MLCAVARPFRRWGEQIAPIITIDDHELSETFLCDYDGDMIVPGVALGVGERTPDPCRKLASGASEGERPGW